MSGKQCRSLFLLATVGAMILVGPTAVAAPRPADQPGDTTRVTGQVTWDREVHSSNEDGSSTEHKSITMTIAANCDPATLYCTDAGSNWSAREDATFSADCAHSEIHISGEGVANPAGPSVGPSADGRWLQVLFSRLLNGVQTSTDCHGRTTTETAQWILDGEPTCPRDGPPPFSLYLNLFAEGHIVNGSPSVIMDCHADLPTEQGVTDQVSVEGSLSVSACQALRSGKQSQPRVQTTTATCGPAAKLTAPAKITRADEATLDASGSTGFHGTTKYRWTWRTGPGCPNAPLTPGETTESPKLTLRVLCPLEVTVEVSDVAGNKSSATATIGVKARTAGFTTTPSATRDGGRGGNAFSEPSPHGWRGGYSVPDCNADSRELCPGAHRGSWSPPGYTMAVIHGGAFDGWYYIQKHAINAKQVYRVNPAILSNSNVRHPDRRGKKLVRVNFFEANADRHLNVRGYVDAVRQHETLGAPGRPLTGHLGRLRTALSKRSNNPVIALEAQIAASDVELQNGTDRVLENADTKLCTLSGDPLPVIWSGKLAVWDPGHKRWTVVKTAVGGGPASDCR